MMRQRRRPSGEVELNVTAMLDMAFQLLAFFILTYKSSPTEGQISLHLPPPTALTQVIPPANETKNLDTVFISVVGDSQGSVRSISLGGRVLNRPQDLSLELKAFFGPKGSPFEQVVLQVSPQVQYQGLMGVIEMCAKTTLADGGPLRRLSFVELPPDDKM